MVKEKFKKKRISYQFETKRINLNSNYKMHHLMTIKNTKNISCIVNTKGEIINFGTEDISIEWKSGYRKIHIT